MSGPALHHTPHFVEFVEVWPKGLHLLISERTTASIRKDNRYRSHLFGFVLEIRLKDKTY